MKKALYGLKQAQRDWNLRIDSYSTRFGFSKSDADLDLYFKAEKNELVILLLYVDDLFLTGMELLFIRSKRELASEFEMKDLGMMHYFLGLEVWQRPG